MAENTDEKVPDEPWGPPDDLASRVAELKETEARKNHENEAKAKGFDQVADYDQWLLLEELRTTTLRMRASTWNAANPTWGPSEPARVWLHKMLVTPGAGAFEYRV